MKVNGNKVKKITLLMALLAPMVYLFGTLFEALKGSNGTITLAQEQEEFVPSSTYEESVNAPLALNPYNADYVYNESSFVVSDVFGHSVVKDGVIVDSQPTSLLSIGVNQWDELVESGKIVDGVLTNDSLCIRTKNFINVLANAQYYMLQPSAYNVYGRLFFYDENYEYITKLSGSNYANRPFVIPQNACFLKVYWDGTTYNNDICINVSNSDFNGNYYPYVYRDYEISFPVLRSAGSVKDNLKKVNVGVADFSQANWTYNSSGFYFSRDFAGLIKKPSSVRDMVNAIASKYQVVAQGNLTQRTDGELFVDSSGNIWIKDSQQGGNPTGTMNYELAIPTDQLGIPIPSMLPIIKGGSVYVVSNLVNDIQGQYFMYEGEYVLNSVSFSDYLFNQFFAEDNFLAESGRKVIGGQIDYGFKPAADLIRFVDGNMFHLANVEYGALVIGYTYYAFHVVCVFLIFNLLMFFPHLIESVYERFMRGV